MSEKRAAAISALAAVVAETLVTTRGLTPAQCRLLTAAEGWPAVLVAYHIGLGLRRQSGWIARALTGDAPYEFDWDLTHEVNAVNAQEHGALAPEEAAQEIEFGWTRLAGLLDRLSAEDWGRDVFSFEGRARSADVVLRRIVLPHVTDHLESLRRTIAQGAAE